MFSLFQLSFDAHSGMAACQLPLHDIFISITGSKKSILSLGCSLVPPNTPLHTENEDGEREEEKRGC